MVTSRTSRKKRRHSASGGDMMGIMLRMSLKIGQQRHERHAALPTKGETYSWIGPPVETHTKSIPLGSLLCDPF